MIFFSEYKNAGCVDGAIHKLLLPHVLTIDKSEPLLLAAKLGELGYSWIRTTAGREFDVVGGWREAPSAFEFPEKSSVDWAFAAIRGVDNHCKKLSDRLDKLEESADHAHHRLCMQDSRLTMQEQRMDGFLDLFGVERVCRMGEHQCKVTLDSDRKTKPEPEPGQVWKTESGFIYMLMRDPEDGHLRMFARDGDPIRFNGGQRERFEMDTYIGKLKDLIKG